MYTQYLLPLLWLSCFTYFSRLTRHETLEKYRTNRIHTRSAIFGEPPGSISGTWPQLSNLGIYEERLTWGNCRIDCNCRFVQDAVKWDWMHTFAYRSYGYTAIALDLLEMYCICITVTLINKIGKSTKSFFLK